jgi:hypothetical protein
LKWLAKAEALFDIMIGLYGISFRTLNKPDNQTRWCIKALHL